MKHRLLTILLASSMTFLAGCQSLQLKGNGGQPPSPTTKPKADTAVSYHHQRGKWHQLRNTLSTEGPKADDSERQWSFLFTSTVSLWRFNPKTGEYDRAIASGSPGGYTGFDFSYETHEDGEFLVMHPTNSSESGGHAGFPEDQFTEVNLTVEPPFSASGSVKIPDGSEFSVTSKVTVKPNERDRKRGEPAEVAEVTRTWRVTLKPDKQVTFTELAP